MDPRLYSENNSLQTGENCHIIDKYLNLETWKKGESVLEIGMGDGSFSLEILYPRLSKNIQRYVGSDISERMVDFAKKKYKEGEYPNVEFTILDPQTEKTPLNLINRFDHIVSFNCFHFFSEAGMALKNLFGMLKPGGQIIASFLERNTEDDIFHNLSKHSRWGENGHGKYVSSFFHSDNPRKDWERTFTEAGFVHIKIFSEDRVQTFLKEKHFNDFFLALDPAFSKVPISDRETYSRDYLREVRRGKAISVKRNENTGDRTFILKYRVLVFIASKPLA